MFLGAPLDFQGEALLCTCHIQNKVPYKKTSKTPYELQKGHTTHHNISYSCLTKDLIPQPKKRKLCLKFFDTMFIGYDENNATYRFLVIKSNNNLVKVNTIMKTENIDFFETIFL